VNLLTATRRLSFKTWPVAAAALAALLGLITTSVLSTARKTQEMFVELDRLNAHHREVETVLRRLRSDVNLSGIFVRDYLLDTARTKAPEYREQLARFKTAHTATVAQLRSLTGGADKSRIDMLERELDRYWDAFEPLFDWTATEKIANSASFLRKHVIPRRDAVLKIAGEIEKLNNANLAAERASAAARRARFAGDLHRQLARTLGTGALLALAAVLRLRWVEKRSDEQRRHAEGAENEMRRLSQQLVAAQEEERKRLSRDLHDQVGQMLTALRMELGRAGRAPGSSPEQVRLIGECKQLVDTVLRSVRDLLMGLRPSMLDDFGLQPALEWHVRQFRNRFHIPVELTVTGDVAHLPEQHRTSVYRIVQEALTNCARHAGGKRVDVSVRLDGTMLELTVTDDGKGFPEERPRGMGLLGIEERVRELGGEVTIRRRTEGGTQLAVSIPLPAEERLA
jgi:signal transduction histidine kinase